jgi:hypothetical protein
MNKSLISTDFSSIIVDPCPFRWIITVDFHLYTIPCTIFARYFTCLRFPWGEIMCAEVAF